MQGRRCSFRKGCGGRGPRSDRGHRAADGESIARDVRSVPIRRRVNAAIAKLHRSVGAAIRWVCPVIESIRQIERTRRGWARACRCRAERASSAPADLAAKQTAAGRDGRGATENARSHGRAGRVRHTRERRGRRLAARGRGGVSSASVDRTAWGGCAWCSQECGAGAAACCSAPILIFDVSTEADGFLVYERAH